MAATAHAVQACTKDRNDGEDVVGKLAVGGEVPGPPPSRSIGVVTHAVGGGRVTRWVHVERRTASAEDEVGPVGSPPPLSFRCRPEGRPVR